MSQKKLSKERFFLSQWFAVGLTLLLLLSSCSTKRGIKTLLDLPVNTTQTLKHSESKTPASFHNNCLSCDDLQVLTVDSNDTNLLKNLSPAAFKKIDYSLLLSSLSIREAAEPIYFTPNILGEVPKYLLFKKLILYNA